MGRSEKIRILNSLLLSGAVTREDEKKLESCYRSCMELAEANGIRSIAFCYISTGVFCFPNELAAEIAVRTVRKCLEGSDIQKLSCVEEDERMETKCENIYKENFPFWEKISGADREYICRNSHMLTYPKGRNIHNGEECSGVIFVCSGSLLLPQCRSGIRTSAYLRWKLRSAVFRM